MDPVLCAKLSKMAISLKCDGIIVLFIFICLLPIIATILLLALLLSENEADGSRMTNFTDAANAAEKALSQEWENLVNGVVVDSGVQDDGGYDTVH